MPEKIKWPNEKIIPLHFFKDSSISSNSVITIEARGFRIFLLFLILKLNFMRSKLLLFFITVSFLVKPSESFCQVNMQDSLALVDLYDSTDGANWAFVQWNLNEPVSKWEGVRVEGNRVTGLELRGAFRSGKIPSSFGNLTALTSIYLLDSKLTEATLPESFENLVNLTNLKMSAVFWYLPFPEVITRLPNLINVDLQDNLFTDTIPASIGNMIGLYYLDLSRCFTLNGSKIPSSMGNMEKLQTLYLTSSNIIDTIPESFGHLDSLNFIDISGNELSGNIPVALNKLEYLNYVIVNDNNFTFLALEPFFQSATELNKTYIDLIISPQKNIRIFRKEDVLIVSVGGTPDNNIYQWTKSGTGTVETNTGDSTFTPLETGDYYVEVTNNVVAGITLKSDTFHFAFLLPAEKTTIVQNITGTDTTYINDGFFRISSLKPIEGPNSLTGNVTTMVTIDPEVKTVNMQPYVQRHYDIKPSENAENAQAIVTLYFSQQDFDNYNNYVMANNLDYPLLPSGTVDNGNVRITQFHGSFIASPDPGNYDGESVLITPNVAWDFDNNWWQVTFYVNGFSGFFLSTGNYALPLSLVEFKAKPEGDNNLLLWSTIDETVTKEFIIQHSIDGNSFDKIGSVKATSSVGSNKYHFTHLNPAGGLHFYRLKMLDISGEYHFSNIVRVKVTSENTLLRLFPNPVTANMNLEILSAKVGNSEVRITDASGKLVYQKIISLNKGVNKISLNVEKLDFGIYYLILKVDDRIEKVSFVKQ